MEKRNKRIVMLDYAGKPIDLFGSIEEACAQTGFSVEAINRCLRSSGYSIGNPPRKFRYEITAGELRQAAQSRRNKKLKEKLEKEWKM